MMPIWLCCLVLTHHYHHPPSCMFVTPDTPGCPIPTISMSIWMWSLAWHTDRMGRDTHSVVWLLSHPPPPPPALLTPGHSGLSRNPHSPSLSPSQPPLPPSAPSLIVYHINNIVETVIERGKIYLLSSNFGRFIVC
jgi:hypothetical protein